MTRFINGALLALGLALPAHAQTASEETAEEAQNTAQILAAPSQALPLWFASTDPENKNEDYILLQPGETRRVPLAAGKLLRLWSTASEPEKLRLSIEGINIQPKGTLKVDTAPRWLLRDGKALRGTYENKTYLWYPDNKDAVWSTLGVVKDAKGVLMAGASAALRVQNASDKPSKWFYQATIRARSTVEIDRTLAAKKQTQNVAEVLSIGGKGPILLSELRVSFEKKPDKAQLDALRLRITEKDQTLVDVPLGPLVGAFADNPKPFTDAMTSWDGQTLELRWPMPFSGVARIEVKGEPRAIVEAEFGALPTADSYRFRAAMGSARNVRKQPLDILQVKGAGAFVGVRMAVSPTKESGRRAFAYLEGNETLVADGKAFEGTGTEDFFNSAWYFPDKPFARDFGGMTEKTALPPRVAMYRLMIADAIPFRNSFSFLQEHGNNNNSDDLEYRWVAFWYQKDGGSAQISDALSSSDSGGIADFARSQNDKVRSKPTGLLPPAIETALGVALLVTFVISLMAIFRRKKKDS
ncbi:MAG TPA: DUF2961 domain-containing protein [Abditibacteriaceae bacterium]|jgi:hypothetical protein